MKEEYIREAIRLAKENARPGGGGPFGAVVVLDDHIIGRGMNRVTLDNDPTAHAEVVAVRQACQAVNGFQLTQGDLYASCEPCPMCLGAIYWARLRGLYYAASRHDAAGAGFDDEIIHREMTRNNDDRRLPCRQIQAADALAPFEEWARNAQRVEY